MQGVVWGATFERACKKLKEIEHRYQSLFIPIERKIETKNEYITLFKNGDRWRATSAFVSKRQRCNISYIDLKIDSEVREEVIKPVTSLPPYNAIQYYDI